MKDLEVTIASLAAIGYSVIRTIELERLQEIEAEHTGYFPRGEIIKPDRDEDFYVCWSYVVDGPTWMGTRAAALTESCPASRLRRADENGTSVKIAEDGCHWDADGLIAEQRGWLPRAHLRAYAVAYNEGRMEDALSELRPFDNEAEIPRQ